MNVDIAGRAEQLGDAGPADGRGDGLDGGLDGGQELGQVAVGRGEFTLLGQEEPKTEMLFNQCCCQHLLVGIPGERHAVGVDGLIGHVDNQRNACLKSMKMEYFINKMSCIK